MISTTSKIRALSTVIRYNKIEFKKGDNPYNLRWQWQWKHGYYTYPKDGAEQAYMKKPEDTPEARHPWYTVYQDYIYRIIPTAEMYWARRRRYQDPFQLYFLPSVSSFFFYFWELSLGFKILSLFPLAVFYTRIRDKAVDPDIQ